MAGRQPLINSSGFNLLPLLGNPLGNSQQLFNQLRGIRMPQSDLRQESYGQDSNRRQRMQFSDDYYNRDLPDFDRGERTFREPYDKLRRSQSQEEDDYALGNRNRIHGLMDREIPLDFLFPEMSSGRYDDRHRREEFERQNYGASSTRHSPIRSKLEAKDWEGSPSESKYGTRNDLAVPWNALLRRNCYLVPPLDDTYVLALSEKQPGCRAVFIGGLPSMADEDIVREIFSVCGPIERISINNARANTQVKHCQLRFVKQDSVQRAVKFNGHVLVIGDGRDRKTKIGRIRVDYDKLPSDNKETESNVANKQQQPANKEENHLGSVYTRKQAFHLLDLIRHDQAITESLEMLAHWLEKGECNRSTVNVFHTMLNTTHSLTKRLISRRKEHELRVEKQKQQAVERANELKQHCEAVWKVFEAATKQKSWDHFTKAQRKNIAQWHNSIKDEIKSANEAEIQNRVEVGMDLDDDVSSIGGLIEQPALQMAEGEQKQEQDEPSPSPSKAKKRRVEAPESDAETYDTLKLENDKLRTQVESLKAIAEQNTNLMWSMQSYQYQAEEIRQQYSNLVAQKEYEIFRLRNALQGANILTDPQRAMSELEIVVDLGKDDPNVTDMDLETGEEVGENDSKKVDGETRDDIGGVQEGNAESNRELDAKERSEHLVGEQDSDVQQVLVGNDEQISLLSQPGVKVTLGEGDLEPEGGPGNRESLENETGESGFKTGLEKEKPSKEEENVKEEGRQTDDKKVQAENEMKPVEKEKSVKSEENQPEEEEIDSEEKEVEGEEKEAVEEEDNAADEKEGNGRFVEIDDEQFEVIDDMDEEDSDDDFKEVTASSPAYENDDVSEQLPTDSSLCKRDDSVQAKTEDGEDDYKEVTGHSAAHDLVNEQLVADSSYYQSDYNAHYQAWFSTAEGSYATMDYGPAQVRISGEELVLVGVICSYLQLCPSGATSGEIRDYLSRQFKERRKDVVERLLYSLPVLFKAEDASGNAKWKFCGFENLTEWKSEP